MAHIGGNDVQHDRALSDGAILEARDLTVDFAGPHGLVRTVHGVDFALKAGETLALLGESGSGKSVTMRALMRLLPASARIGGRVTIDSKDVLSLAARDLADLRGRTVSMVFQDPGVAFDPVYRIGRQIEETIRRHDCATRQDARARALELFERVRIPSARERLNAYPHELSGGMRQRAMIALALACRPKVLLADEPTTALDATVQIQVLLLLRELQAEFGLAVVFVTHDVGAAVEVADRIAVMYAGRLVEDGTCRDVIRAPAHPYTGALLGVHSGFDGGHDRLAAIPGAPPDPAALPPGCAFSPRCPQVRAACRTEVPHLRPISSGHLARCILAGGAGGT
jgi:peptide/nickel transport system ATP-binding protein